MQRRTVAERYLDLMEQVLTRSFGDAARPPGSPRRALFRMLRRVAEGARSDDPRRSRSASRTPSPVRRVIQRARAEFLLREPDDPRLRREGRDWPRDAETMMGLRRLRNVRSCLEDVLRQQVPGDVIETGVWRGGGVIFMKAILEAHGDTDRRVWVADSFAGLPKPDPGDHGADLDDALWRVDYLAVSEDAVRRNFERYGLLDEQVRFLPGWFEDTLPTAPIDQLALLRLDGDLYSSTMVALEHLYPKLSVGGYAIIDDYGAIQGCRDAVEDYRAANGITETLAPVDWSGVFWRRER